LDYGIVGVDAGVSVRRAAEAEVIAIVAESVRETPREEFIEDAVQRPPVSLNVRCPEPIVAGYVFNTSEPRKDAEATYTESSSTRRSSIGPVTR
jgi:hypothetical protein